MRLHRRGCNHGLKNPLPDEYLRGDFTHVRECFRDWRSQPLVYRRNQQTFEGKQEVRSLSGRVFNDGEVANQALERVCEPGDPYALAAEIRDGERDL